MYKLRKVYQDEQSYDAICSRTTKHDFVKFSKKTSKKYFEDKNSTYLNYFVHSGKTLFVKCLFVIYLYTYILNI